MPFMTEDLEKVVKYLKDHDIQMIEFTSGGCFMNEFGESPNFLKINNAKAILTIFRCGETKYIEPRVTVTNKL